MIKWRELTRDEPSLTFEALIERLHLLEERFRQ